MRNLFKSGVAAAAASVFLLAPGGPAAAAEVTMRVEHVLPAQATIQKDILEPWCADIEEASNNRIECEIYPSMQLGGKPSQMADIIRNGVVEVGFTALGYAAGRFPRSEVLELPFVLPSDSATANQIIWEFAQTHGKDDFKDYKLLLLFSDMGGTIHTTKKAVRDMDSLKGLRIRAATRMSADFLSAVGGVPVSMPPGQISDSLAKGVIDGALATWEVVKPTKLNETTFFHTEVAPNQAATNVTVLGVFMNQEFYDSLGPDLQAVIDKYSGQALVERAGKAWQASYDSSRSEVEAADDPEIITLDEDTYRAMKSATADVLEKWAAQTSGDIDRRAILEGLRQDVREKAPFLID